jgi:hypothetical protein
MKTLCRWAVNALLYLVTIALVLGGIAVLAAGGVANVRDDGIIAINGLMGMICVRRRLAGKPFGPSLSQCFGWTRVRRNWPGQLAGQAGRR